MIMLSHLNRRLEQKKFKGGYKFNGCLSIVGDLNIGGWPKTKMPNKLNYLIFLH